MSGMKKILFFSAVLLQLSVLGIMIVRQEYLLHSGRKIILRCEPLDPRSLFSGDYVVLTYRASDSARNSLNEINPEKGATVYAVLSKEARDAEYSISRYVTPQEYKKTPGMLALRGTAGERFDLSRVTYGIEEYFVPQDQGKLLENKMSDVSVEVSVDDAGRSAISKVFVSGKEVHFR